MKKEKGSITMIVGATLFFIFIILDMVFTTAYIKNRSQIAEFAELQNAYDGDMKEIYLERITDEVYNNNTK